MTKSEMRKRAEELAWRDTADSYWEGPEDGSDKGDWAVTISKHRDSDALQVSNYNVISRDMISRFEDDVEEHSFSHWAVGWVEHLFVRIHDEGGEFTPAFVAIMEWEERLEEYPIADEDDYSETEMEMGEGEWEEEY